MRSPLPACALSLLLALAAPAASQTEDLPVPLPASGVTITVPEVVTEIPPGGSASVEVTVEVGCGSFVLASGETDVVVTTDGLPSGVTATPLTLSFSPGPDCLEGSGYLTQIGHLALAASADAPGLQPGEFNVTATLEPSAGITQATAQVGYKAGHAMMADIDFPATVEGDTLTFNVTLTITANARTMVMFERTAASAGSLSGLASQIVEGDSVTFPVTFKAPEGRWHESNVTFYTYSHYLLPSGESGPNDANGQLVPQLPANVRWTFVSSDGHDEGGGGKDSPGVGVLLALGVLALAFAARRRE